jgi:hypothetical protein
VKEFANNELPLLIEKGLLDGREFEPTSLATTMADRVRFELAANGAHDITNNIKRSLDMAGVSPLKHYIKSFYSHQEVLVSTVSLAVLLFRFVGCLETF